MSNVYIPAGSRIFMQSAIGAAQTITGISAAKPPVVTHSGTDPANGDYVVLTNVFGMGQFEDALTKVANVNAAANTFEMLDQDATGYPAFVSGQFQVVTLGTEISTASGFMMDGGEQQFAEYNLLWDKMTRRIPSTQSPVDTRIPCIWDPFDPSSQALRNAGDTGRKLAFKILLPSGLEILFSGYVGASGLPSAQNINEVMQTTASISMASKPRYIKPV
ncbi:phage tail protein [Chitiniphilus purpureus]|uniref:Phage tail protein n=1 Tax=Chitiniphilus purpureus TaxID=2981137 RepID=A0ABY6DHP2_9NEIS|nr:phage tail protein [Chitiniphilus sp. CD1]UXY13864.1 phage tail protein [Chitiniphilus sp. CD1]